MIQCKNLIDDTFFCNEHNEYNDSICNYLRDYIKKINNMNDLDLRILSILNVLNIINLSNVYITHKNLSDAIYNKIIEFSLKKPSFVIWLVILKYDIDISKLSDNSKKFLDLYNNIKVSNIKEMIELDPLTNMYIGNNKLYNDVDYHYKF